MTSGDIDIDALRAAYAEEEREAMHGDLRHVMSTIEGRRFVDMLRHSAGIRSQSYAWNGSDRDTNFHEGRRSVAIELDQRLLAADDLAALYDLMEKEHRERIRARNAHLAGK